MQQCAFGAHEERPGGGGGGDTEYGDVTSRLRYCIVFVGIREVMQC